MRGFSSRKVQGILRQQTPMSNSPLVWSPVSKVIEQRIAAGDELILLVVPFVKLDALNRLLSVSQHHPRLKVIVRWRSEDILAGASDLDVYPSLKKRGIPLYLNPDIHLKLYIFESNHAFNTSGNITMKGLGYSDSPNIEVGNVVPLVDVDWVNIYRLINDSRPVDDDLYGAYQRMAAAADGTFQVPKLPQFKERLYTIQSLPATGNPNTLLQFYRHPDRSSLPPEEYRRAIHDLVTYRISPGLSADTFLSHLKAQFQATPFVIDFVSLIKGEKSLRFGAVNAWIHRKCEDVPLPYRWEINENTRILYNWLAYFFPEITWDIPGEHSQVIYWEK